MSRSRDGRASLHRRSAQSVCAIKSVGLEPLGKDDDDVENIYDNDGGDDDARITQ